MYITQGTFSYLPPLTDNGWAVSVEYTDDPHPRNFLWDMWGLPMFDMRDPAAILLEINRCREANPQKYVRVNAYDSTLGRQTTALQYIVQRPDNEPGFRLERQEGRDRQIRYTLHPYSLDRPAGERYQK
jgi:ribulose-bisphosphate carboxylase small chain